MKKIWLGIFLLIGAGCTVSDSFDIEEFQFCEVVTYTPSNATFIVGSIDEFFSALDRAQKDDIIYVSDDSFFSFSESDLPILVTESIKIVSGRKVNGSKGATFSSEIPGKTLFNIRADNVLLHGLRILGNDFNEGKEAYNLPVTCGVMIENFNSLIIENCEISGWSHAGIQIKNSRDNKVVKNHIHSNRRTGLGYGVAVHNQNDIPTGVLVSCNILEFNRHDIAGSGNRGQSYEASYNFVGLGSGYKNHRFDMHGKGGDKERIAGTSIIIHNNRFLDNSDYAIKIRGIPEESAQVFDNIFSHASSKAAVQQTVLRKAVKPDKWINIDVYNNRYLGGSIAK